MGYGREGVCAIDPRPRLGVGAMVWWVIEDTWPPGLWELTTMVRWPGGGVDGLLRGLVEEGGGTT